MTRGDGTSLADQLSENVAAQVLAVVGDYSQLLFPAAPGTGVIKASGYVPN